jgi:TatD DNase family protein
VALNLDLNLVDVHCHINFDEFDRDRALVIERAGVNGIKLILNPGIDIDTSKTALKCSEEYQQVFAAVGVHPNSALSWTQNSLSELKQLAGEEKVIAIGEIGLDYYRNYAPRELQHSVFIQQLELAAELSLPVIIHNREASEDILYILQNWHKDLVESKSKLAVNPGEMHSFSGTLEFARALTSHNFKIGIAGPVTFRNSQILQSVIRSLPLESLLLETDAPYLSPHPFRGKRNEPANVRIVADKVAELKDISIGQVAKSTTEIAHKVFNWREIH